MRSASFVTLACIAMMGVRNAKIELSDRVVVIGLGFIGQMVAQMARLSGARVFVTDLRPSRVAAARRLGAGAGMTGTKEEIADAVKAFSSGVGADVVIICASHPRPPEAGINPEHAPIWELAAEVVRCLRRRPAVKWA